MSAAAPTDDAAEWFHVGTEAISVGAVHDWVVRPDCGAVVVFSGTVRDHAEGREDVSALTYEAFEEKVEGSFHAIVDELRTRWRSVGRVALIHRLGRLSLGESSVVAAVSAPHRPEAFEAARFAIDALKSTAPIWKKEHWRDGEAWGTGAATMTDPTRVATAESSVTWSQ